ncbi:hypothetical protein ACFOLF_27255 [Paenibacillus sepulcri]
MPKKTENAALSAMRLLGVIGLFIGVLVLGAACSSNESDSSRNDSTNTAASADHSQEGKEAAAGDATTDSMSEPAAGDRAVSSSEEHSDSSRPFEEPDRRQTPEPQAGMLTAGEWNDLDRWSEWEELLDTSEGADNRRYWSFFQFERLQVKVTGDGRPVQDAEVAVIGQNGQSVWEARTDENGTTSVFADLFEQQGNRANYLVEVKAGGQTKRFENVDIPRSRDSAIEIKLDQGVPVSNTLDLMLVVDTTGSMGDELNYLKTELKDVVQQSRGR